MNNRVLLSGLTAAAFFVLMALAIADSHMDHYWTIKVDGKSESAGKIAFKMTSNQEEDGTQSDPIELEIMVPAKAKRKDIQTTIENNFRATLGDERYKVKTHGSDEVSIKAKDKTPWFTLEMTNNTVQGISVALKH